MITRQKGLTLYIQIARKLEQEVIAQYAPGDGLPSEGDMAERFGVNRHTLRRAVDELVEIGLLERRHGCGVYVINNQLDYQLGQQTRFTETLAMQGIASHNRVVRKQLLPATERVAQKLHLAVGDQVIWLESVRSVDSSPVCIISHFLDAKSFPELFEQYQEGSLHAFISEHYGIHLLRTESLITSVLPQGDDARLLSMPQKQPVLRVKSVNINERDRSPVEYVVTRFRADRIQLCINP
ncbi:MAG: phosphonate metabolism transcriptional regulator PhnF [Marinospirillum sp.]|uniref:phosphonate metabolism transcriptional regulator PhnF n=1 Tax=Marinospirillum sp. TaxID=2183934 RepID=UPI0019F4F90A|nr:phosphonate metabolism transcriptional regulator PhnF [Marinospirillum sp.]MBE0507203.1 phosphonate metabolism transcriptional regulator PhnF [Marinospirillum sp.]